MEEIKSNHIMEKPAFHIISSNIDHRRGPTLRFEKFEIASTPGGGGHSKGSAQPINQYDFNKRSSQNTAGHATHIGHVNFAQASLQTHLQDQVKVSGDVSHKNSHLLVAAKI